MAHPWQENKDLLDEMEGVRVITIHQSERPGTNHVCVPGMVDGSFPLWTTIENDDTEEERRVLLCRRHPRTKNLDLVRPRTDPRGPCQPSRFLSGISQ